MPSEVLRELILELTEPDRLEIIREAGIPDDRPSLLRGDADEAPLEEADSWVTQNGAKILPHLLRRIDPSDDEMVQLVQSEMLPFDRSLLEPREFLVRFNHPAMRGALDGGLPLPEVAATSLALTELITSLLAANRPFGADAVMPTVRVAAGSVDFFTTGPGLIRRWVGFTRYVRRRCDLCSCHSRNGCPHGCYRSDAELAEAKFRKGKKRRREGKSRCREGKSRCREGKSRCQKDRSGDNRPRTGE